MNGPSYKYMQFLADFPQWDNNGLYKGSDEDVAIVEAACKVSPPLAFRELVQIVGRYAAFSIVGGSDLELHRYGNLKTSIAWILDQGGHPFEWQDNYFVFAYASEWMILWFMKLDEGENPPVYRYEVTDPQYEKVADSFVDFVKQQEYFDRYLRQHNSM